MLFTIPAFIRHSWSFIWSQQTVSGPGFHCVDLGIGQKQFANLPETLYSGKEICVTGDDPGLSGPGRRSLKEPSRTNRMFPSRTFSGEDTVKKSALMMAIFLLSCIPYGTLLSVWADCKPDCRDQYDSSVASCNSFYDDPEDPDSLEICVDNAKDDYDKCLEECEDDNETSINCMQTIRLAPGPEHSKPVTRLER